MSAPGPTSAVESLPAPPAGGILLRRVVGFLRLLRDNGFPLGLREALDAARIARDSDLSGPEALRQAWRALLCTARRDWLRFDEIFELYWRREGFRPSRVTLMPGAGDEQAPDPTETEGPQGPLQTSGIGSGEDAASGEGTRGGASAQESLAKRDLRHVHDPEEQARIDELAARLAARMRYRLARRERRRRRGRRLDLRRTIHGSVPYGGTPFRLAFKQRWPKPLRLVVILDVSGSMSLYSGFFLRFLRGVLDRFREAEAFVLHTRLVHISAALRERDGVKALERTALMATGWDGGTRIGDSLKTFNDHYAARTITGRTAVIIVSDGYDTGEPERLAEEMARLRRRTRRIVWLNPMMGWDGYEPVARGMTAALPYLDLFAPAHDLESLAALEPYLAKL